MANGTNAPAAVLGPRKWGALSIVGLIAVVAGVVLPQMFLTVSPLPQTFPTTETAPKDDLSYTPPSWPEAPDSRAMLLRLGIATVVVLGLCVVVLWVGKRWLVGPLAGKGDTGQLRLLETLALGNRCCVHLVQAANRQVLVGVDATGMKSLIALPELFGSALAEVQTTETAAEDDLRSELALSNYRRLSADSLERAGKSSAA